MNTELVKQAVSLFTETMALENTDINTESAKWHDLYSKECELYGIFPKFTEAEAEEYRRQVGDIEKLAHLKHLLTEAGLDMSMTHVRNADSRITIQYGYWEPMPAHVLKTVSYWCNLDWEVITDDDCGDQVIYYVEKNKNSN